MLSAALRPTRWTRRGNPRSGRFAGGKTFGVICQRERSFKSHSPQPEGRAKSCRGQRPRVLHGEAMPLRRGTTFSRGMTLAPLTLTLSRKGRGELILHGEAMPLSRGTTFSRGMTLAPLTLTLSRKGRGDQSAGHRGLNRAQRLKRCRGKRHKQKPQPQGLRFFYWLNLLASGTNSTTGLRHGASWSCRRCLPARCPSR